MFPSTFFKSMLYPKIKEKEKPTEEMNIKIDQKNTYNRNYIHQKEVVLNKILNQNFIDLRELKDVCWGGIPKKYRGKCWRIFLRTAGLGNINYNENIEAKKKDYFERKKNMDLDYRIVHQIELDVMRIEKERKIFDGVDYSGMLTDILKVYAHERTVVSYIQGLSDLLATFLVVFIDEENANITEKSRNQIIESSSYFCFARLVDNIQDNYIDFQKSVFKMMKKLREIVEILEPSIIRHFLKVNLEIHMFAFRWFNCCFVREFDPDNILVIFDSMFASSYISFHDFMLFFGVTLLISYKDDLIDKDFGSCLTFLQDLKSRSMKLKNLQIILSKSRVNYNIFHTKNNL